MEDLRAVRTWLLQQTESVSERAMASRGKKTGYAVLFDGSAPAKKRSTVDELGKEFDIDVYRVDLGALVSKYIGETEKNLDAVFEKASDKDAILFFDEADALFGKRTEVKDAHDRYANQEIAYLLQRVEDYSGLVILATNFKSNIDDTFIRRFQTVVKFGDDD